MDLVSGKPYWPLRNGLIASYPPLAESLECDVAVLGAGISGALIAWRLAQAKLDVVVVDKRDVGTGSTVASTGLLQYELDTSLIELSARIGTANAVRAYRLCRDAVLDLERIDRELGGTGLRRTGSLQGASRPAHVKRLRAEADARRRHGFDTDWWSRRDVARASTLPFAAALLTPEAGQVDTHRLTHAALAAAARGGARIFDRTRVTRRRLGRTGVQLHTDRGFKLRARQLVIATGYETGLDLPRGLTRLISTFALVSEPVEKFPGWPGDRVIWETARPYAYVARTNDQRILMGGADVASNDPARRDALVPRKAAYLARRFAQWMPRIPFETGFPWAATFAETPDGLPYIGKHSRLPHTFFALGYGGNGIPFSAIAAELLRDLICEGASRHADLFRFERVLARKH